jgi:alkanesulfonate monooxygenase SsuD/methylene tetrahydromethanopterin reductase-like flavin-dependent oxidoreductase (luciferase family)
MPIDFGLQLQAFPFESNQVADLERFYRQMVGGLSPEFTTLWMSDHLQFGDAPVLEGWTRLTYLAALFPTFRFGHLVLGQGYRNPAILAKMGATLQHLTGGRFILGLGAGWAEEEYRAYGFGYPSPSARVEQLEEAIQIIRSMWTEPETTFLGKHYLVDRARCEPRPDPVPPILIGSPGPRVIRIAAQWADGWSWDGPMDVFGPPYAELQRACAAIGRDISSVWRVAAVDVDFPDDPNEFESTYDHSYYPGKTFRILGPTPADAIAALRPLVEIGVTHFAIAPSSFRTLERFSSEVAPVIAQAGA